MNVGEELILQKMLQVNELISQKVFRTHPILIYIGRGVRSAETLSYTKIRVTGFEIEIEYCTPEKNNKKFARY